MSERWFWPLLAIALLLPMAIAPWLAAACDWRLDSSVTRLMMVLGGAVLLTRCRPGQLTGITAAATWRPTLAGPVTKVTLAPNATSASAMAVPCAPLERLAI